MVPYKNKDSKNAECKNKERAAARQAADQEHSGRSERIIEIQLAHITAKSLIEFIFISDSQHLSDFHYLPIKVKVYVIPFFKLLQMLID